MRIFILIALLLMAMIAWHRGGAENSSVDQEFSNAMPTAAEIEGGDIDATNMNGHTRLMLATAAGDLRAMRALIASGANVNFMSRFGRTPLTEAARMGRLDAMKLLLDAGADPNLQLSRGQSALYTAAECGNEDCVLFLLKHGASINNQSRDGRTALIGAAGSARTSPQMIRLLLDAGADPDIVDNDGCSAKSEAASIGRHDLVREIVSTRRAVGAPRRLTSADPDSSSPIDTQTTRVPSPFGGKYSYSCSG